MPRGKAPKAPNGFRMLKASLKPTNDEDPIDSIVEEIKQLLQARIAESQAQTERLQGVLRSLPS